MGFNSAFKRLNLSELILENLPVTYMLVALNNAAWGYYLSRPSICSAIPQYSISSSQWCSHNEVTLLYSQPGQVLTTQVPFSLTAAHKNSVHGYFHKWQLPVLQVHLKDHKSQQLLCYNIMINKIYLMIKENAEW